METLSALTQRLRETGRISRESIPDMELYMDQLLGFLNQRLLPHDGRENAAFTKTMVNNYTKDHLLIPPRNKKYARPHVLLLILIHNLKGILTISDIKRLFAPILQDISTPDDDLIPLEEIYDAYLDLTDTFLDQFQADFTRNLAFIDSRTEHLEGEDSVRIAQLFLSVLVLLSQANLSKKIAELILEQHFPAPGDPAAPTG